MKIRQPSLARELLLHLLPLMSAILIVGGGVTFYIAYKEAAIAYDRALMDESLAVASQVEVVNKKVRLQLPAIAEAVLLIDAYDRQYYEVIDLNGEKVAGNAELPRPTKPFTEGKLYYDGKLNGNEVRVAALSGERNSTSFIVLFAETKVKRDLLLVEVGLALLVPGVVLIIFSFLIIRRGIHKGLAPIGSLQKEIIRRSQMDLSHLPLEDVPKEIYSIFSEINSLFTRLSKSLNTNRSFIADASHQLRTPIAILQGEAELALTSSDPRGSLKNIVAAARRITHLAHQLLTISRLEQERKCPTNIVDLAALTRHAAERWVPLAYERKIDLGFELNTAKVMGSPIWLEELANNLIDNAIRYTPSGGVVTVRCGSTANQTSWEIEDSGPGIPKEEHEHIFERFYRLDTNGVDGCGLGLAIAREIALSHSASITIENGPNLGGSLLRVAFPPI